MKAAVVIPAYREELRWFERISLDRCVKVLGRAGHPIVFMAPEDADFEYIHALQAISPIRGHCFVERFPREYFSDRLGYSKLMMSPEFYERFLMYDYILIHQLDAFVFSDQMERFCRMGYDYIGAPWPFWCSRQRHNLFARVGNGGFSLRRVEAFHRILSKHPAMAEEWDRPFAEDAFFACCGKRFPDEFRVAPVNVAWQFSWELVPERYYRKNGNRLPFGVHGWMKSGMVFYREIFPQCGFDVRPYDPAFRIKDSYKLHGLQQAAYARLLQRLRTGRPLAGYLPAKESWSVQGVGEFAMAFVQRLQEEGIGILPSSCIYSEDSTEQMVQRVKELGEPCLLICKPTWGAANRQAGTAPEQGGSSLSEEELFKRLEQAGLSYGRDFVSFWREYLGREAGMLRRICGRQAEGDVRER